MNKKFFSALVMGSLLLGGTVVSCSDYDDDITNLQEQIDKLASAADLESKANQLASQIQSAQAAAEAKAAAAQSVADAAKAAAGNAQTSADAAQATADAAQAAADAVRKTAEELASDLTATKEAVATAQAAADAAQAAADAAKAAADSKATPEDVAAAVAAAVEAQAATDAAQNTKLEELAAAIEAVKTEIAEAKTEEALKAINEKLAALGTQVADLAGVKTMITSISLVEAFNQGQGRELGYWAHGLDLGFKSVTEQSTKFGPKDELVFTEGKAGNLQESSIIVRVSPTNVDLTALDLCLLNSQGEKLDVVEILNVAPYTKLMTRAASASGLWEVKVGLKENVKMSDAKAATTVTDEDKNVHKICYAIAAGSEDRMVVSSYDITAAPTDYVPAKVLDMYVSDKEGKWNDIEVIRNRWSSTEQGPVSTAEIKELVWYAAGNGTGDKAPVFPTTKEKIVSYKADGTIAESQNVIDGHALQDEKINDNRQKTGCKFLAADVNIPINLALEWSAAPGTPDAKIDTLIAGFYVTLDEARALESTPSELNAWKSYEIEGLNTVFTEDNRGTITIKSEAAKGDIIGFRVYAVNLDGTLVDPDGRAFYAVVSDASVAGNFKTMDILATDAEGSASESDKSEFKTAVAGLNKNYVAYGWTNTVKPVVKDKDGKEVTIPASVFTVKVKENRAEKEVTAATINTINWSKVTEVWYEMPKAQDFVDGGTYTQVMEIWNGPKDEARSYLVKTIEVTMNKVMPSEAPEVNYIEGQTSQLFMAPSSDATTLEDYADMATQAVKNLQNVFYELREDPLSWVITAGNSVYSNKTKDYTDAYEVVAEETAHPVVVTENAEGDITDLVDGETEHVLSFAKLFEAVSYKFDAKKNEMVKGNYVSDATTETVTYNCWDEAQVWAWDAKVVKEPEEKDQNGKVTKAAVYYKNELQWMTETQTIEYPADVIAGTNSYNPQIFNASLAEFIEAGAVTWMGEDDDIYLINSKGQKNDYFTPSYENGVISFVQNNTTSIESAPRANVKETLVIKFMDCYGHVMEVECPFTVLKPVATK